MPPVRALACAVARKYRANDLEDLFQIGMEAVTRLFGSFDPARGAAFLTFVYERANGAMIDHLRKEGRARVVSRLMRRGMRIVQEELEMGDLFTEDDAARAERYDEGRFALSGAAVLGWFGELDVGPMTPEDQLDLEQERQRVTAALRPALAELDPTDRDLVMKLATDDVSLAEGARSMGLAYDDARYRYMKAVAFLGKRLRRSLK